MMIGYDIYDRFTVEHFPLRQSMILTTFFFLLATVVSNKNAIWGIFKMDIISQQDGTPRTFSPTLLPGAKFKRGERVHIV
jgi:hypothetical protein